MRFFDEDEDLRATGRAIEAFAADAFRRKGLPERQFAFVLLTAPGANGRPRGTSLRADWRCYPCSLVKLFHLVAVQAALEEGRLSAHEDLDRAMRDMILWSSNTATNYVIDLFTETTGDTLLDAEAMADWQYRRRAFNRFFAGWDWPELAGINLDQKLMDDRRYGRELAGLGPDGDGHNALTPIAMARLMYAVFHEPILPAARAELVRGHLRRHADHPSRHLSAYQLGGYLGSGLPAGSAFWSKAGRTRWVGDERANFFRHDAIRAVLPDGRELFLTVMTHGEAINEDDSFLPQLMRLAVDGP
ncbi:hypothetical protein STVA_11730 [Allostella vacuolata]|nr:hypothetical protein STVA_11730 [Stella vacuolata]